MKMIDVINMMREGRIKEGTKLKIGYKIYSYIKDYTENENCSFVNQEDDRNELLEDNELITTNFLNLDVELIKPKVKKYCLRLVEDDSFSYINLNRYACYELANKDDCCGYKTEFTQEEIDNDKVLKFVEIHGIKEAVDEDETN